VARERCVASAEAIAVAPSAIVAAEAMRRCLTSAEGIAVAPSVSSAAGEEEIASGIGATRMRWVS
jgi:hypothetical protein